MVAIDPVISSQGISQTSNKLRENQNRKEKQEQVAAGVGGAAGLSQTTKLASKRGLTTFPLLKHCAGFLGGALAFFVLVTGVNKAVKTGAIAVDDFKHQINDFKSIA